MADEARDGGSWLTDVLSSAYGLEPVGYTRVHAGTATDNYIVSDVLGRRWFAKVYRSHSDLQAERAAIELADFARAGGVPVPMAHRTIDGAFLSMAEGKAAMSLWEYVPDAVTAEVGLTGDRWASVGAVLGRLHRRLAEHPAAAPSRQPATGLCDVERAGDRYDWLIAEYRSRAPLNGFERWALEAAQERRALLHRVDAILQGLPQLTTQILHGDLAAPNLFLRGNEVAAVIDFQPPTPWYVSWEIARIACDPRTVMLSDEWMTGLSWLLSSYREENPSVLTEDLTSTVAVGCAYTIASTYPLAEPVEHPGELDAALQIYARARHAAALRMLTALDRNPEMLRDISEGR